MRRVEKPEALELLAIDRQALLGDDSVACVMCALVTRAEREQRLELLAENEHGVVLLDRFGSARGHLLVISREHLLDTAELPWRVFSELQQLNHQACCAVRRVLQPARIYSAILGSSADLPMSFPHFHIHVLPVYARDELARPAHVFSWSSGVMIYEEEDVQQLSRELRAAWPERSS